MKRLLLPLLAALALPTAVNAETWWLIMRGRTHQAQGVVSWTIPTSSEQECKQERDKAINLENWKSNGTFRRLLVDAVCLKGK